MMLICDVTDDASVQKMVDEVLSKAGRIDLLVNNSGIGLLGGRRIVNLSSVQGFIPAPYFALYCSTKHAESLDRTAPVRNSRCAGRARLYPYVIRRQSR
jgi:NAD(P)-dependent dehydrogenase (short-subunit alcohol dehydrogenase family)